MSNANGFKAQYKTHAGASWSNATSGTEHSCLLAKERLEKKWEYVRVIDSTGRVVA